MKIGILTFFRPINYGAFLQAYALSHRLNQEEDIQVELIDFHMQVEDFFYWRMLRPRINFFHMLYNWRRFRAFREALQTQILSSASCCSNSITDFIDFVGDKYDVIIAGSDEIWKIDGLRGFPTPYFLIGELHCKKVAYAASGRTSFELLTDEQRQLLKKTFDEFEYLGVRDKETLKGIEQLITKSEKLHYNFDPTFVYDFQPDKKRGTELLKRVFKISGRKPVIAVMYSEKIYIEPSLGRFLRKTYGDCYEFISVYEWMVGMKKNAGLSPFDWIDIISAVDGVISMYFHGICFSMITGTPFLAIEKRAKDKKTSKIFDLLNRINLNDFYAHGLDEAISGKLEYFFKNIHRTQDFSDVICRARTEFMIFIDELRKMCNEVENK